MKIFFEEFGMVIVVSVLMFSLLGFADTFKEDIGKTLETQWDNMLTEASDIIPGEQ